MGNIIVDGAAVGGVLGAIIGGCEVSAAEYLLYGRAMNPPDELAGCAAGSMVGATTGAVSGAVTGIMCKEDHKSQ